MSNLSVNSTKTLSNGVKIPLVGFGCAEIAPWTSEQRDIVLTAINAGYRLLDTAIGYQTEFGVREAIKASGVPRDDFFITSKMPSGAIREGIECMSYTFEQSLRNLDTDYIDLYLVHWPPQGRLVEAWKFFETQYYAGRVRAIGISNVNRRHFLDIMANCDVPAHVMQDEFHPYRMNEYNRIFCEQNNIHFEAFLPLVRGKLREDATLMEIAAKYGKNTFQVILRWDLQHGVTAIPRSSKPDHIRANIDIFDFELTDEEMARIDAINVERMSNRDMDNFNF